MNFAVEQECPQCGGRIELDEADRFIQCPFCNTRNFLVAGDYFRYYLPPTSPVRDVFYSPYMRFKGAAYTCAGTSINHRLVDLTFLAMELMGAPLSLGVRPQARPLKFITADMRGPFIRRTMSMEKVFEQVGDRRSVAGKEELLHQTYIGESVSCIYLPLYIERSRVHDGVSHNPFGEIDEDQWDLDAYLDETPETVVSFLPTICPNCGWDLEGERDSVVLTCAHCDSAYETRQRKFVPIEFQIVSGVRENTAYLPFWRVEVKEDTLSIGTFGDYARVMGNPVLRNSTESAEPMTFWIPAFKIRPAVFLRLAGQMTIFQEQFVFGEDSMPETVFPVTLPRSEAFQALTVVFAGTIWNEKKIFPLLPRVAFRTGRSDLVYLPFDDTGRELIQQHTGLSVHKNIIRTGQNL